MKSFRVLSEQKWVACATRLHKIDTNCTYQGCGSGVRVFVGNGETLRVAVGLGVFVGTGETLRVAVGLGVFVGTGEAV